MFSLIQLIYPPQSPNETQILFISVTHEPSLVGFICAGSPSPNNEHNLAFPSHFHSRSFLSFSKSSRISMMITYTLKYKQEQFRNHSMT